MFVVVIESIMNKTCSKCCAESPSTLEFFPPRKAGKHGLSALCRVCDRERKAAYRKSPAGKAARARSSKRYRDSNKDYWVRWRANNPEYLREWWARNPEKRHLIDGEAWRKANFSPEEISAHNRAKHSRRRARKLRAGGSHTKEDIRKIVAAQGGVCWWCQCKMTRHHIDHRIPLARGGTNDPSNLVACCPRCNQKKHAKMPWEMTEHARLI
jgi:5-methylcytosine-specific restriction endonuclease McrA